MSENFTPAIEHYLRHEVIPNTHFSESGHTKLTRWVDDFGSPVLRFFWKEKPDHEWTLVADLGLEPLQRMWRSDVSNLIRTLNSFERPTPWAAKQYRKKV